MLVLNIEKGMIEVPDRFTEEERQQIEQIKARRFFKSEGLQYAGHCLRCHRQVLQRDKRYLVNKDGLGNIEVELYHKLCSKM